MIQPGQIYRPCDPRGGARIRITAYRPDDARAQVVDAVTGKRPRQILVKDLHESPVTATGWRRRSGYVLDRDVPMAPQEATEGRLGAPEGASGQREAPRGQNGPQAGAQRFQGEPHPRGPVDWARQQAAEREQQPEPGSLQQRIAAAIRDTPARYPDDIATAVMRVPELQAALERADRHDATIGRVRKLAAELFVDGATHTHRAIGRQLLNTLQPPEDGEDGSCCGKPAGAICVHDVTATAHNAGPSVAEAAANDRRWWNGEKAGE